MNTGETFENTSKANQKIEEFKRKHADMHDELKRRILMLKMKNLRMLMKQMD